MSIEQITEPWRSFLSQVEQNLTETVELHCFGGFVVTTLYGLARSTHDLEGYFESKGLTGFSEKIPIDSKGLTANLPSRVHC
jgi:hypothetical protein